jgi:rubrerythrin
VSAALSRRRFIVLAGGSAAAATALAACGTDSSTGSEVGGDETSQFGAGDVGLLNYALTLEYVEVAFYAALAKSKLLAAGPREALGKFGEEEEKHVALLIKQLKELGGDPAPKPKAEFALKSEAEALEIGGSLENLGAAAYLGQAPKIESVPALKAVLSIHSVEGRHAAALDSLREEPPTPDGAFAKPATVTAVMQALEPYIGKQKAKG